MPLAAGGHVGAVTTPTPQGWRWDLPAGRPLAALSPLPVLPKHLYLVLHSRWFTHCSGLRYQPLEHCLMLLDSPRGPVLIQGGSHRCSSDSQPHRWPSAQSSPERALALVHLGRQQAQQRLVHTHPEPRFPDFIQWHVHSGDGGRHKVGPDLSWSPGGTTHHALQMGGGTGGLGGPSRSLCTREEAVSAWVPLAQAHSGRG